MSDRSMGGIIFQRALQFKNYNPLLESIFNRNITIKERYLIDQSLLKYAPNKISVLMIIK